MVIQCLLPEDTNPEFLGPSPPKSKESFFAVFELLLADDCLWLKLKKILSSPCR